MQAQLVHNILGVHNKHDMSDVIYSQIIPVLTTTMYSSMKSPMWRLKIDELETTRKTPYLVKYRCITCASTNTVAMVSFLRKLNSNHMHMCYNCRNFDEGKRAEHSKWMTGKDIRKYIHVPQRSATTHEVHMMAIDTFNKLSDTEKSQYYKNHLTIDQMAKLSPQLISLHNGNIPHARLINCQYWDIYPTTNQMRFTPVFYDPECDEVIRILQPLMKCEQCDTIWRCKNMKTFVDATKILCPACKLCRKTFKIRSTLNLKGDKVVYQSKPEFAFLEWCKEHNIEVTNGPYVPYIFNKKARTYKVDFYIPHLKYLVEVKDNHCWHKAQVESGQWECKLKGVDTLIQEGQYNKFLLLTPQTKRNCLQEILARISKI